jgi:hypothetical protein
MGQPIRFPILERSNGIRASKPATIVCDADLGDFISGQIEHRQHRSRRHERDFMFARASSEENSYLEFAISVSHLPFTYQFDLQLQVNAKFIGNCPLRQIHERADILRFGLAVIYEKIGVHRADLSGANAGTF